MENNKTTFEEIYENAVFEKVYNECSQRLTEVGEKNFWSKIVNGKSGLAYANAFLTLYKQGHDTPINLEGTLNPERYLFGNRMIRGIQQFTNNGKMNTFLIEKIYEEMLLAHKGQFQKEIQSFMKSFMLGLSKGGIEFVEPNFVDYKAVA